VFSPNFSGKFRGMNPPFRTDRKKLQMSVFQEVPAGRHNRAPREGDMKEEYESSRA
jgi:hypothetical protein